MGEKDKRIDAYIANSAPFAKPILKHLRRLVHDSCQGVQETIKWGFPHFDYAGEILCSMASFKKHCSFGFWKASLLKDPQGVLKLIGKTSMGSFGQITSLDDLPEDEIIKSYIKEAAKLNEDRIKLPQKQKVEKKVNLPVPKDLISALKSKGAAWKTFENFSASNRREYVEWILDAKSSATRQRRIETAVEWMTEGKVRNWKYVKR
jgi:uncharacterized protein YdeI (YjbR/CyaY-like superfamily)